MVQQSKERKPLVTKERLRPIVELWKLVKREYEAQIKPDDTKSMGICIIIRDMNIKRIIDRKEECLLKISLDANRPSETVHKEYYHNPLFKRRTVNWWSKQDKVRSNEIRLLFIEQIIRDNTVYEFPTNLSYNQIRQMVHS